jgi:hypothetical protein
MFSAIPTRAPAQSNSYPPEKQEFSQATPFIAEFEAWLFNDYPRMWPI